MPDGLALKLQEYDMEIKHRPGRTHNNADALSRLEDNQVLLVKSTDFENMLEASAAEVTVTGFQSHPTD